MPEFTPCTLKMGQDGDPSEYFPKVTGFGYNDMISLPTLTKDSILENLKRRFKVRPTHRTSAKIARRRSLQWNAVARDNLTFTQDAGRTGCASPHAFMRSFCAKTSAEPGYSSHPPHRAARGFASSLSWAANTYRSLILPLLLTT